MAVFFSCVQLEPAEEEKPTYTLSFVASFDGVSDEPSTKATVSSTGLVYWSLSDKIAVCTSNLNILTFDCVRINRSSAVFKGLLFDDEVPEKLSVFPAYPF